MKKNIFYYSDCTFFAGCESMLANFINSDVLASKYNISLIYRYSKKYEQGLETRINKNAPCHLMPLKVLSLDDFYPHINKKNFFMRNIIKFCFILMFLNFFMMFYNTILFFMVFRKTKPDILHINNGGYPAAPSCYSVVLGAKLARVSNIVYVINNIARPYSFPKDFFYYFLDRLVFNFVTIFVTGSKYASKKLTENRKVPNNKVISIHNGIGMRNITEHKEDVCSRLGINTSKILFVVISVFEKRKGHIVLLDAIKHFVKDVVSLGNEPLFLIEGDFKGPEFLKLEKFVMENNLEKYVKFIGVEANVFNLLNAADVLVLPSISNEDFPNVILEGMANSKIVIATDIAGVSEQIEDGCTGFIVEPNNANALACRIRDVVVNIEEYRKVGYRAKDCFEKKYRSEIAVLNYVDFYEKTFGYNKHEELA